MILIWSRIYIALSLWIDSNGSLILSLQCIKSFAVKILHEYIEPIKQEIIGHIFPSRRSDILRTLGTSFVMWVNQDLEQHSSWHLEYSKASLNPKSRSFGLGGLLSPPQTPSPKP